MTTQIIELDKRLDDIGWGVLLITTGVLWLLPGKQVPHGSWLISAGLIMLGLNAIRYFNEIRMNGFSLIVGTLVLLAGVGEFLSVSLPLFAIALILIGVCSFVKRLHANRSTAQPGQDCC